MNSRDTILNRIRTLLADSPPVALPLVPEVWPRENPGREVMAERFAKELEGVQGEIVRCGSVDEARAKLLELMDRSDWKTIAACERPEVREVLAEMDSDRVSWCRPEWEARDMAELPAGLVVADTLLADTGSCLITCGTAVDRLMCYLPPVCVVLARTEQLVEHLPAAWPEIVRRAAAPELRGEFVIVTGPSRTADIEKILILGVHGPKRLIVLLIDT